MAKIRIGVAQPLSLRTLHLRVHPEETIAQLKDRITQHTGISATRFSLTHQSATLEHGSLAANGVTYSGALLNLVPRICSGHTLRQASSTQRVSQRLPPSRVQLPERLTGSTSPNSRKFMLVLGQNGKYVCVVRSRKPSGKSRKRRRHRLENSEHTACQAHARHLQLQDTLSSSPELPVLTTATAEAVIAASASHDLVSPEETERAAEAATMRNRIDQLKAKLASRKRRRLRCSPSHNVDCSDMASSPLQLDAALPVELRALDSHASSRASTRPCSPTAFTLAPGTPGADMVVAAPKPIASVSGGTSQNSQDM